MQKLQRKNILYRYLDHKIAVKLAVDQDKEDQLKIVLDKEDLDREDQMDVVTETTAKKV